MPLQCERVREGSESGSKGCNLRLESAEQFEAVEADTSQLSSPVVSASEGRLLLRLQANLAGQSCSCSLRRLSGPALTLLLRAVAGAA